eukprot:TRINITY_DN12532_c0_g1_i1.p1 TRINITY_DN12532_c0_g1~~TRINITY_DN12532_c0_g1_i1.p1  ORF type:complete len:215 (+),score=30.44 TRINITY_DN12532_c0_g1_i1:120-764(+)
MEGQREGDAPSLLQYYLAVDRQAFKLGTLVDLLEVLGRRSGLPIVLCCCSRDVLDRLCESISSLPYVSLTYLYSDMPELERASSIEKFRQKTVDWFSKYEVTPAKPQDDAMQRHCHVLITTDACLPMPSLGEAPLFAQILINFDLPLKKEAYLRRLISCTSGSSLSCNTSTSFQNQVPIVINMVVGAEVATLKVIEEGCNIIIEEMPIQISEMF